MRMTRPTASAVTYMLGKNLYIPLTHRCNSLSLPETRGPNFLLPPSVVMALCTVRDLESGTTKWQPWCRYLETVDESVAKKLPPRPVHPENPYNTLSVPSVDELVQQVQDQWSASSTKFSSIVIRGEGEPTQRWDDLVQLIGKLKNDMEFISSDSTILPPKIRLTTNGLLDKSLVTEDAVQTLANQGLDQVSVAVMSSDPHQYEEWMQLIDREAAGTAHADMTCFVQAAVACGLDVEATAVDRPQVDKGELERYTANILKVSNPVRWRPYFP